MSKIPKEIVDKIEQRNKLNEEIETWCKEHLDMDGMDSDCADITDHHIGKEQGNDECKEWSEQWSGYEDAEEKDRLGQWIPCSERLPEDESYILAVRSIREMMKNHIQVTEYLQMHGCRCRNRTRESENRC